MQVLSVHASPVSDLGGKHPALSPLTAVLSEVLKGILYQIERIHYVPIFKIFIINRCKLCQTVFLHPSTQSIDFSSLTY